MRSYEEDFSEVICPEGSKSPYQRLLPDFNSRVSHCYNRNDGVAPMKITGHPGVSGE